MSSLFSNRLIKEKSPYLLQHAHNPVDWYPWGPEAFEKAKAEDKPVFLSIGYSTCHWCHVMERESFEDQAIAEFINQYFVAIKVDREERPDIDSLYMSAVTAMTGAGGWPLSVFLTADKEPFYGGTYFPPEPRWGSPGFKDLLVAIHQNWTQQRDKIINAGQSLTTALKERAQAQGANAGGLLDEGVLDSAYDELVRNFDQKNGGFGYAPKFPTAHSLSFLLRYWQRTKKEEALAMVCLTLDKMAAGGIVDHLGGGFHRYSTDHEWQVPHFEKMLYDQAIVSRAYLEAYQATGQEKYATTARAIFEYVLRDLQDKDGGFYSAEDADSPIAAATADGVSAEKKEGAFYVWAQDEIRASLTPREAEICEFIFDILPEGNARQDPHGEFVGKNLLWQTMSLAETARHFKTAIPEVVKVIETAKAKLLAVRDRRPRPHLDDKILVDWNGLMLSSLALGSLVLQEPRYRAAAEKCADFILQNLRKADGTLLHRYRDGEAKINATLCDYSFFVHGLLDLYMASLNVAYLHSAVTLSRKMTDLFEDKDRGGFFAADKEAADLIFREKNVYDGALPSGNSLALLNCIRLYHFTFDNKWLAHAESLNRAFALEVNRHPSAYTQFLIGVDFVLGPVREWVIAGELTSAESLKVLHLLYQSFDPRGVVLGRSSDEKVAKVLAGLAPFTAQQVEQQRKITLYCCTGHVCQRPWVGLDEVERSFQSVNRYNT